MNPGGITQCSLPAMLSVSERCWHLALIENTVGAGRLPLLHVFPLSFSRTTVVFLNLRDSEDAGSAAR